MKRITGTSFFSNGKLRLVLFLSLSLCAMAQQPDDWSEGCPNHDQIEPHAGKWKTWVLSSGSQIKLPPPPQRAASEREISNLKQLAHERDEAALDLINYWNAGSPSFRWNELAINR